MAANRAADALLRMRAEIAKTLGDPRAETDDFESKWGPALDEIAHLSEVQRAAVWVLCLDALERRPPMRDSKVYGGDGSKWLDTCRRQLWCLYQCATTAPDKAIEPYFAGAGERAVSVVTVDVSKKEAVPVEHANEPVLEREEERYEFKHHSSPTLYSKNEEYGIETNTILVREIDIEDAGNWIIIEADDRYGQEFMEGQAKNLIPMLNFLCDRAVLEKELTTRIAKMIPPEVNPSSKVRDHSWFYRVEGTTVFINPTIVQSVFQLGKLQEGILQHAATREYISVEEEHAINASFFYILYLIHMHKMKKKIVTKINTAASTPSPYLLGADDLFAEYEAWDICPIDSSIEYFATTLKSKVHVSSWFLLELLTTLGTKYRQVSLVKEHKLIKPIDTLKSDK